MGFAGLPELAVALLLLGLLLPLVGLGLDSTWRLVSVVTARAAAGRSGLELSSTVGAILQGAQPLGYCASPDDPSATGSPVGTPLDACSRTALGPPPPGGAADWSAWISPLPDPSAGTCGRAELGPGALVTATSSCVGFFSYDDEPSGAGTGAGALAGDGPFTPPDLMYVWRCRTSCPEPGGAGLWLTAYAPTGSYTDAGCPTATVPCTNADWSSATSSDRYLGPVLDSTGPLFGYQDAAGDPVALGAGPTPSVGAASLAGVNVVSVSVAAPPTGADQPPPTEVALTGNVYRPPTPSSS
jgi:hypothetical protein